MTDAIEMWRSESMRLLELAYCSYEIALRGIPTELPITLQVDSWQIQFDSPSDCDRVEREISDAFFLRLKGLMEAQLKRFPGSQKPNWKSAEALLTSLGTPPETLCEEDREMLGCFCAIRNCIAHSDGRVDDTTAKKLPNLAVGSDVWMTRVELRNWFRLCGRLISAVGRPRSADGR
jgi:hypothetical protein